MRLKKILSVFLAAVMLYTAMSVGLTGVAAEIDYNAQYRMLAEALKNEHVRELTNYTVTNKTLDNGTEGFDQEARGFAYDHAVVAKDNTTSDILVASNRFYYIAESLMSYKYGVGCYDASTLVSYVLEKLEPYFASTSGDVIYEDFYGNRYYPSEEEVKAYNNAVSLIEAAGGQISQATLTEYGIYFMVMNDWEYYNVETIIKYFVGNVLMVNAGNWYHRFSFIVETSISNILEETDGVESFPDETLTKRKAVYQFNYQKTYNETMSKSYYCFEEPSIEDVWNNYGKTFSDYKVFDPATGEYVITSTPDDLTKPADGFPGLLKDGQAANYLIKVGYDSTTVPFLREANTKFRSFFFDTGTQKWDEKFVSWSDATVTASPDTAIITGYVKELTKLSNDALLALFGDRLGNMVTLAYLLKTSRDVPTRTVRGEAIYEATPDKLNEIIYDLDALISPRAGENNANDVFIANRVATVLQNFLDIGGLLGTSEPITYTTLDELVGKVLQQLVFSDAIVNLLVELLYPMIVNLLVDNLGTIDVVGGLLMGIVDDVIDNNGLAIYPNKLGDLIDKRYPGQYPIAVQILRNGGDSWENVNVTAIKWGVDETTTDKKADAFLDALCAGLCGFTNLLVCFLCGNEAYSNKDRQDIDGAKFGKLFDIEVLSGVGWVHSQGLYTKLFIPLYRVLGIPSNFYMTDEQFEKALDKDTRDCLRNAVEPIIKWVTDVVAKRPFETIMKLVPNLVYFLSREGTSDISEYKDWWEKPNFFTNQEKSHGGWALLQSYNLFDILENTYLSIVGSTLAWGQNLYTTSLVALIGNNTLGMLTSLNALLNEVISLTYDTDEVFSENIACYSDYNGNIVLPDSTEYALNPAAYPLAHMTYYSDSSNTKFSLEKDDEHPFEHKNITYVQKNFYLPAVPEAKLISCGTVNEYNHLDIKDPGLVFLFLLRYVFSALGYRYTLGEEKPPMLIECLGLDLSGELFMGLSLGDIVYNIMLHPDEAICALLELFYSNETGDFYKRDPYTYPIENINYHETTLLNKTINPTLTYGTDVKYSKYWTREYANDFVSSLAPLAEDVLIMLGVEGMEDGIGPFLKNMLNDMVFNNALVDTLFNLIYQLLGGLNDSIGFDIEGILNAVLDVNYTPAAVSAALVKIVGHDSEASRAIGAVSTWAELFTTGYQIDPVTGEQIPVIEDVSFDWGIDTAEEHGHSRAESFLKIVSALLSPAAFAIKFLFMDMDLDILGLVKLPGYAGYQYAFIALLEALSCPDILSYDDYYEAAQDPECGDANTIYHLFSPLLSLLEKVYADPVNTLLSLIPNLLFFISIGGLNGLINNLVHFAYVLLDILKPIINAYDLLGGLLANIDIGGLNLNLTLPLDIDVNSLVSDLLGSLLGDVLTIEGVSLKLPYIDLYTLCVGTLEKYTSKEIRSIVRLNAAGGGELLTALLRIVFEVLFMDENHKALSQIISNLAGEGKLDEYDEETLYMVIDGLFGLIEEYEALDIVLYAVYMLVTYLVPVADTLAPRFEANDMTITELIDSAGDQEAFMANIQLLLKDPNEVEVPGQVSDMDAIGSLFERIKAFFEKIKLFLQQLFNFNFA